MEKYCEWIKYDYRIAASIIVNKTHFLYMKNINYEKSHIYNKRIITRKETTT